ncbi:hypothetical protein [Kitasatospora sp. NPDC004531]
MSQHPEVETDQRVVRRNWVFWRLLVFLAFVAGALFVYTVFQENLAASATPPNRGPVQLLDFQSATAALLATGGALLARAQYATTVRPMIGFKGRVIAGLSPVEDELVWASRMINGADSGAVVREARYTVLFKGQEPSAAGQWMTAGEADEELMRAGLQPGTDYRLTLLGKGYPVSGDNGPLLGWFTSKAMDVIEELGVKVRVRDKVGDEHERSMGMLKGAVRAPRAPQEW